MKIMITGANGVVGKELAYQLSKDKKNKIFLLSNSNIKIKKKKFKFIKQDLTLPLNFRTNIDVIIHCASKNPLSKTGRKMETIYKKNFKMTKNLIKFSNENNVKKIIFLSSMDVYGKIKNKIVFENQKKLNVSLYGKSKYLSEKYFCDKKNKFKAICLRIPGVFTANISRKRQPLIINILKKVLKNENIDIYNFNKHFNNIIDPREIAKFINVAIKIDLSRSDYYNFCASRPIKFINVVNLIKKIFKSKSKITVKNSKKNSFIISNSKIKNYFNFKISTAKNIILRNCRKIKNTNYKYATN
jgi:dTDP-glucose 4,6-dehydratase